MHMMGKPELCSMWDGDQRLWGKKDAGFRRKKVLLRQSSLSSPSPLFFSFQKTTAALTWMNGWMDNWQEVTDLSSSRTIPFKIISQLIMFKPDRHLSAFL